VLRLEENNHDFLKMLAYRTLVKKPQYQKYKTFEEQMRTIRDSVIQAGEELEVVKRRNIFRLVMRELENLVKRLK